jgi:mannonate dehydratase
LFAEQFGVTHILAAPIAPAGKTWDARLLVALRNRAEKAGFRFAGLDGLPQPFNAILHQTVMEDGGDLDALTAVNDFVACAGAAGVPLIRYDLGGWTASPDRLPQGRGRALVRRLAYPSQASAVSDGTLWEHMTAVLQHIVPAAEQAGVKLACRPGPPHNSTSALQRLINAIPSAAHGLDFCQDDISRMSGVDLIEAIHQFGARGRIFLVEVANWQLDTSGAVEAFLDEPADQAQPGANLLRALRTYREIGFDGAIRPAPPPGMVGDTAWGHKGQAFNVGYLRALLHVVERTR